MTLQDYIDTVPPDLKVSIGPNAGYFYIGYARKFDPEPINKRLVYNNAHNLRDREYEVNKYLKRHKSPPERYCRALERAKRKVAEFAPIETREVKEVYTRIFGGIAIIVEGDEATSGLNVHDEIEPDYKIKYNAEELGNAVVKCAALDYAYGVRAGRIAGDALTASKFFGSDFYKMCTSLDGDVLKKMIKRDPDSVIGIRRKNGEDEENA
jgi:hypothetical protein